MVSDFVTGEGRLKVRDEIRDEELMKEGIQRDAAVYFEYGGKNEGHWKGEDMVRQVLDVAVKVFEKQYLPRMRLAREDEFKERREAAGDERWVV